MFIDRGFDIRHYSHMFVRIEVAVRPDYPDPLASNLLKRIQIHDAELRRKIRWARLLDVYWLEIPRAREEIIPACQEIFQDKVIQWLFTGNLIPSASGKQGGIEDLLEASPVRPGKFWGLERRLRQGVPDSKAHAALEALKLVLGEPIPGLRASTGQLLLLEGVQISEEDLSRLARNIWCNPAVETWSFLPENELSGNDRFFQDRVRKDETTKPVTSVRTSSPTLQSFAQRLGSPRISAQFSNKTMHEYLPETALEWDQMDSSQQVAKAQELTALFGRSLLNSELKHLLDRWSSPEISRRRSALGLPKNPTIAELQVVSAAWSEEFRQTTLASAFAGGTSGAPGSAIDAGLLSSTLGATVQQVPKSWIISAGDHRPAVIALDENTWISFALRNSSVRPTREIWETSLQGLLGAQRDLMGGEWASLPLAQSMVHFGAADMEESARLDQISVIELASSRSQVPIIAGAEGALPAKSGTQCLAVSGVGVVVRKTHRAVRPGDRLFVLSNAVGTGEHMEDPVFHRVCLDALIEIEARGFATAIRVSGSVPLIAVASELARQSGGLQADAETLLNRKEQFIVAVPSSAEAEFKSILLACGVGVVACGQFTDSGHLLLTRGASPVAFLPLDFIWMGPPMGTISESSSRIAGSISYQAPDYPAFEKQGDRMLHKILSLEGVRSAERLILSSDIEAQAHLELKPLNVGSVGSALMQVGPNDGSVIQISPQLLGLSEATEGQSYEIGFGVGLFQRDGVRDSRWEAENALDEAIRNCVSIGGSVGARDSVAGVGIHWFGPKVQNDERAASELKQAFEGVRDSALAMDLPVLSVASTFSEKLDRGFLVCQAISEFRARRRARSADFKYAGDVIYTLGPEVLSLVGSRFASVFGCAEKGDRRATANWNIARRIYSWLGGAHGKEQQRVRSVHDISDGGLLVAVAESCFARRLGATLRMPVAASPEIWAFGEGFHRFIVTCSDTDSTILESEWDSIGVPFQQIGVVTGGDRFEVLGCWNVSVSELSRAWKGEGPK